MDLNPTYAEKWFRSLTPGEWYNIKMIPRVIGVNGLSTAAREQILKPDYEIVIGKYYATFKIVRAKTETLLIMERIEKAV